MSARPFVHSSKTRSRETCLSIRISRCVRGQSPIHGLRRLRPTQEGTSYTITDHVNELHAQLCPDKRTLQLFTSLINHLHAFAREVRPTHAEWETAVEYLTRAGKESTVFKNEFVLLSDCLGISALIDELQHPKPDVRAFGLDDTISKRVFVVLTRLTLICRAVRKAANPVHFTPRNSQRSHLVHRSQRMAPSASRCTLVRLLRTRKASQSKEQKRK